MHTVCVFSPLSGNPKSFKSTVFRGSTSEAIQINSKEVSNIYECLENTTNQLMVDEKPSIINQSFTETKCIHLTKLMDELIALDRQDFDISLSQQSSASPFEVLASNFRDNDTHFIKFEIPLNNDDGMMVTDSSLPVDVTYWHQPMMMSSKSSGLPLRRMIDSFRTTLSSLNEFYNCLETIDTLCYVVDPEVITTRSTWRTFKFNERVHLKVTVEPFDPSAIEVKFIGPTVDIQVLHDLYDDRVSNWDVEQDAFRNLLRIFDLMYFPMRPNKDDGEILCNICFSNRLEGQLPLVICDNRNCNLLYHSKCLRDWFSNTKKSKTFWSVTFGECPNCLEVSFLLIFLLF